MPVAGADAVGTCIATADHDHPLASCENLRRYSIAGVDPVLLRQELHREMHAVQVATGHIEVTRQLGATGNYECVKVGKQLRYRHCLGTTATNLLVDTKLDALSLPSSLMRRSICDFSNLKSGIP